jgi:hypothetical protein
MMAEQRESVGLANGGDATRARVTGKPEQTRPTLAEAGIDKNLAKQARALGALSDEDWRQPISILG